MKLQKLQALTITLLLFLLITNDVKSATVNNPMTQDLDGGGFKIFNILDFITKGPWIDARSYNDGALNRDTIYAAVNAAGSAERTIWLAPGTWQISSSLLIPLNITLKFERGACLNIPSGITLLVQGKIEAGPYEIFDISGGGTIDFSWPKDVAIETYPQWWGVVAGKSDPATAAKNTQAFRVMAGNVVLPTGDYYIDDTLHRLAPAKPDGTVGIGSIRGNGSTIYMTDPNRNIMEVSSGEISNLNFNGGALGAYISTDNVDQTVIKFDACTFSDQSVAGIGDDGTSNSTILIVNDCEFLTSTTGVAMDIRVDVCTIRDCRVNVFGETAFINSGVMKVRNLLGVAANNTSTASWFENYGTMTIQNARFGGESGGRCVVENYTGVDYTYVVLPSCLYIENSEIYTDDYVVKFYNLPNRFILRNNSGYTGNYGLYLDPGIPSDSRQYFPFYGYFDNSDKQLIDGPAELAGLVNSKDFGNFNYSTTPLVEDLVYSAVTGVGGWTDWYSNTPMSWATYPYNGIPSRKYEGTTGGQYFAFWRSPSASLFVSDNLYTVVFDFVCEVNQPLSVQVSFGDSREFYALGSGLHILSVPYFWSTGKSTEIKFSFSGLSSGDVVYTGRCRIFKSNNTQKTVNTVLYGNSATNAPSSSDISFATGDKITHIDASAGGHEGKMCVTAGTPGTWKTFGQIIP